MANVELANAYITLVPSMKGAGDTLRKELNPAMAAGIGAGVGTILATGISRGMSAVGSIIPDAISAGGELEQSMGAIDTVFKAGAGSMHQWAAGAANDVGLTKNEFNTLGTLIGSQLKNGGTAMDELAPKTRGLITTGADLASMFGGTTQEAVEALSSALKGERDPIEKYGVSLSQAKIDAEAAALGFEKVGGTLSAEASQAATLSLITKQTADAHGNFAKEADTTAGKQQRLTAAMGNAAATLGISLLPVMNAILPVFQDMATRAGPIAEVVGTGLVTAFREGGAAIGSIIGFVQQFSGAFIGVGAILAGVTLATIAHTIVLRAQSGALMASIMQMGIVRGAVAAWAAIQWVLNAALSANPIGIVVVVLAGLVAAVVLAYQNVGWFRDGVNNAWRVISSVTMGVLGAVGSFFTGVWTNSINFGRSVIAGFVGFVTGAWNNVRGFTMAALGAAGAFLRNTWAAATGAGRAVIAGFVGFVSGAWSNVRNFTIAALGAAGSFLRSTWAGAVGAGRAIIAGFVGFVSGAWNGISGTTRAVFSGISGFFSGVWSTIVGGARNAIGLVVGVFSGIGGRILGAVGNLGGLLVNIGRSVIDGLISGIQGALGGLGNVLGDVGRFIAEHKGPEAKDRVLLRPAGRWIVEGLARSIEDNVPLVEPALTKVSNAIAGQSFEATVGIRDSVNALRSIGSGAAGGERAGAKIYVTTSDPETASELTARKLNRINQR